MMRKVFSLFLFILLMFPTVYSLGVSQDYLSDDNTLRLYPGQNRIITLTLQNEEDFPATVLVNVTGKYVNAIDKKEYYDLAPKTYNTKVLLNISVPSNATIGEISRISYLVAPTQKDVNSPKITMTLRIRQSFNVEVIEDPNKPVKESNFDIYFIKFIQVIGVLSFLAVLFLLSHKLSAKILKK